MMKWMKRWLLRSFIALSILMLTAIPGLAAQNNAISIGDVSVAHGDDVTIPIMIYNATGVAAVGLNLSYQPGVVSVTNAEQGDFTGFFAFDDSSAADEWVTINTYITGTQLTGDLIVANVTLEATGSGGDSSLLNLEVISMTDQYASELSRTIRNGTFKILSADSGNGGSSGGSGGGNGGGSSGETYANIVLRETKCVYVSKDESISYEFEKPMNDIIYVNFTARTHAGDVCTMVEMLKSTSTSVKTDPPDNVYKNINIRVGLSGYTTEKNIRDASITFRVDQTWISNIDPSAITLNVYHNDSWHPLKTTKIGEDGSCAYFTAGTDYFGRFAITARNVRAIPARASINKPAPEQTHQPSETAGESRSVTGFDAMPGLVGLVIACLLSRKHIS